MTSGGRADVLEALGGGAGHRDGVRGEGLAHLLGSQGQVVVNEQQVGHDALPLGGPGHGPKSTACPLGILFAVLVVGSTRVAWNVFRFRCNPLPAVPSP
jgi:hypothetical protein